MNNARIPNQYLGESVTLNKVLNNYGLMHTQWKGMKRSFIENWNVGNKKSRKKILIEKKFFDN